jgi:molybdopterin synthase catalytic subunit
MITIRVKFFAQCRDLAGTENDELRLPGEPSVKTAMEMINRRYPSMKELTDRSLIAVNEEYAAPETRLSDGDMLAILPPVSGGSDDDLFHLTREPIDTPGLVKRLLRSQDGAVVAFEGVVRDHSMGKAVLYLEYEAYDPMALKIMQQIGQELHQKWPIDRVGIIHRLGRMEIGETSVAIVVTSAHRREAFEACHYAIDRLKKIVPIWKREYFEDGAVWVEGQGCSHDDLPPATGSEKR